MTRDVDDDASGSITEFFTSADGTTWTQLGGGVQTGAVTSIHAGTHILEIGASFANGTQPFGGTIFSAQVYDGIDGTLVADFNPARDGTVGAATVTSSTTSEVWTMVAGASIVGYE